ncbi:hypothetical protein BGW37DRAFT_519377 [Umbelopsis sp. PMI_123]|nr:hypothetical protein BGW37DRAFT_519377 [Umbelopsis sp. PMI_123]
MLHISSEIILEYHPNHLIHSETVDNTTYFKEMGNILIDIKLPKNELPTVEVELLHEATKKIPNYHELDETVSAIQLQTLARAETTKLRQGWMLKYVSAGLFIPQNETADQQFRRFFKMINLERMLRGTHPSSIPHT